VLLSDSAGCRAAWLGTVLLLLAVFDVRCLLRQQSGGGLPKQEKQTLRCNFQGSVFGVRCPQSSSNLNIKATQANKRTK